MDLLIVSHTIEDADCAENNHKALVAIETHLVALFPGDDLERAIQFVFHTPIGISLLHATLLQTSAVFIRIRLRLDLS